jgi:undecaprenol kinase
MGKKHSLKRSFAYAFNGLKSAFRIEPNLRIHLTIAFCAMLLGLFLHLSKLEWLILILTSFFVIFLELINTVLEQLVNLASPDIKKEARIAKDVSAAAVLVAAFVSVLVGIILFLPKIILLL